MWDNIPWPMVMGSSPTLGAKCSMKNKNPEKEIGVQPENQKSKAAKPLEKSYQGWVTTN